MLEAGRRLWGFGDRWLDPSRIGKRKTVFLYIAFLCLVRVLRQSVDLFNLIANKDYYTHLMGVDVLVLGLDFAHQSQESSINQNTHDQ